MERIADSVFVGEQKLRDRKMQKMHAFFSSQAPSTSHHGHETRVSQAEGQTTQGNPIVETATPWDVFGAGRDVRQGRKWMVQRSGENPNLLTSYK